MKSSIAGLKRTAALTVLGAASLLGLSGAALALPSYGPICSSCHGDAREAFEIENANGMANPDGGIGFLKFINAQPGTSVQLTANVVNGTPSYGVALVDSLFNPNLLLAQGPGSSWTFEGSHFSVGPLNYNAAHTFDLLIPEDTAAGYYSFTFRAAGFSPSEFWSDSESFYIRVVPEAGTLLMLSVGLGMVGFVAWKRRNVPA